MRRESQDTRTSIESTEGAVVTLWQLTSKLVQRRRLQGEFDVLFLSDMPGLNHDFHYKRSYPVDKRSDAVHKRSDPADKGSEAVHKRSDPADKRSDPMYKRSKFFNKP